MISASKGAIATQVVVVRVLLSARRRFLPVQRHLREPSSHGQV